MRPSKGERMLLMALDDIKDINRRRAIIRQLTPHARNRLLKHFTNFIEQKKGAYRISKANQQALKQALAPHKKSIQKLLLKTDVDQTGSGIFTILFATLVPLLVEAVRKAVS